jgi:hypothetical protein
MGEEHKEIKVDVGEYISEILPSNMENLGLLLEGERWG